jgi:hypothetical protein
MAFGKHRKNSDGSLNIMHRKTPKCPINLEPRSKFESLGKTEIQISGPLSLALNHTNELEPIEKC